MEIKNLCCAITGAGNGLGRQMALDFAGLGAKVYAIDINEDNLKKLQDQSDGKIKYYIGNVCDEENIKNVFESIAKENGSLDVLINNAGITKDGLLIKVKDDKIETMSLDSFQRVIDVNLTGVFLCSREAVKIMQPKKQGVIINISSVSRAGNMGQTNYSAAKAGVDAMTVTWSKELARYNIRCAAIAPGYIATEMVKAINPAILEKIVSKVPLRRLGEMSEISRTAQFIIENDFVNGKILEVDGGLRI